MDKLSVLLVMAGLVCACFAAFMVPNPPPSRPQLGWLAVAFFLAALVVRGLSAFGL